MSDTINITVGENQSGIRVDKFLTDESDLSRTRIQQLIDEGHVYLGSKKITSPSHKTKSGDTYKITIPAAEESEMKPQAMDLDIIFENNDYLVLNKPAGLVVHPAAGNPDNTLVNALLAHCGDQLSGIGGVKRPGIVHRLDKDTSGLMVVAKNDKAHEYLSAQFADRSLSRTYLAVVHGVPRIKKGIIKTNIGRHPKSRQKMAVLTTGGKEAITHYEVTKTLGTKASIVKCKLETGRTHQIRVHMQHLGHPLVGDGTYASRRTGNIVFPRQALHAYELQLKDPKTGKSRTFKCEIPNDINELIDDITSGLPS